MKDYLSVFKLRDKLSKTCVISVWVGTLLMAIYFTQIKEWIFAFLGYSIFLLELNNEFNNRLTHNG